jgi:hypothetical protein
MAYADIRSEALNTRENWKIVKIPDHDSIWEPPEFDSPHRSAELSGGEQAA